MKNYKLLKGITWISVILTLLTNTLSMFNILSALPNNGFKEALDHLVWAGDLIWAIGAPIAILYLLIKYWNIDTKISDTEKAVIKLLAKQKKELETELADIREKIESNDTWLVKEIKRLSEEINKK